MEGPVPNSENFLKQTSIESLVKLVPIPDDVYQETVVAKPMLLEHASDKEDSNDIIQFRTYTSCMSQLPQLVLQQQCVRVLFLVCPEC